MATTLRMRPGVYSFKSRMSGWMLYWQICSEFEKIKMLRRSCRAGSSGSRSGGRAVGRQLCCVQNPEVGSSLALGMASDCRAHECASRVVQAWKEAGRQTGRTGQHGPGHAYTHQRCHYDRDGAHDLRDRLNKAGPVHLWVWKQARVELACRAALQRRQPRPGPAAPAVGAVARLAGIQHRH
jgi:hypothetical protein